MKLTFLGTSAGAPTIERNVSALALAIDDQRSWYLIDCGEGTQHQLLYCRYSLAYLKAIFITHIHGDHIFGLPGLLKSASMQRRKMPLLICGPEGVETFVRHALVCADVMKLPFELSFSKSQLPDFSYNDDEVSVTSHALSHSVPCFAYRFTESGVVNRLDIAKLQALDVPKGALWGELQKGKQITLGDGNIISPNQVMKPLVSKRVVVIGGDNDQPALLDSVLKGADLLVHESTFSDDMLQKVGTRWMHSSAKQVAESAALAKLPYLILTHFSGRYRLNAGAGVQCVEALRQEAQCFYQGKVELAEDFGVWHLSRNGGLIYMGNCRRK